jgi:hypothetical protein
VFKEDPSNVGMAVSRCYTQRSLAFAKFASVYVLGALDDQKLGDVVQASSRRIM